MSSSNDLDKAYVSPYDKFMYKFDQEHEKSPSQIKEINKHKRIANLRDNANPVDDSDSIWEQF
ncbi:CBU_0585 family protein [Legionella dresdenensis]|uniref:CBU_0585 family protein n=1 Tax=Legionella dresdenensis TaxID=450200 RepID=A0ABV8CCS4_9GAMM